MCERTRVGVPVYVRARRSQRRSGAPHNSNRPTLCMARMSTACMVIHAHTYMICRACYVIRVFFHSSVSRVRDFTCFFLRFFVSRIVVLFGCVVRREPPNRLSGPSGFCMRTTVVHIYALSCTLSCTKAAHEINFPNARAPVCAKPEHVRPFRA